MEDVVRPRGGHEGRPVVRVGSDGIVLDARELAGAQRGVVAREPLLHPFLRPPRHRRARQPHRVGDRVPQHEKPRHGEQSHGEVRCVALQAALNQLSRAQPLRRVRPRPQHSLQGRAPSDPRRADGVGRVGQDGDEQVPRGGVREGFDGHLGDRGADGGRAAAEGEKLPLIHHVLQGEARRPQREQGGDHASERHCHEQHSERLAGLGG
mmetsp:Transcript_29339/g.93916  ORF Transcript_29339/g.93916 Transcript_29339/m.93916 type:complete len:209 (+) Transcript_29339:55-681(+)